MSSEITIIIPTIKVNDLLIEVINKTISNIPNAKIYVISNNPSSYFEKNKNIKIFVVKKMEMSFKRNFGAKKANTKFLGFIDSDAYPVKNWAKNGIEILSQNNEITIITGPELSFLDQTNFENVVGICNKSFFITGSHCFRKSKSSSRFFDEASSCNMLVTKNDYFSVNGMNENLYVGEDREFCKRITAKLDKKIYFSCKSVVHHKDRGFCGFVIQRVARGHALQSALLAILESLKSNLNIINLINQRIELFVPLGFILFLLTFPLIFISNIWLIFYTSIVCFYILSLLIQALILSRCKMIYFPFVFVFLIIGTLTPGIVHFLNILRLNIDISKIYRNSNDK